MAYLALARQYRPKAFDSMVGQHAVVQALKNALDKKIIHHAYLFTGTRGVGKTTLARLFAKCLNCQQGISSTPCGVCDHCKEIDAGCFVDLFEIDAASRTKVEDTRELLDNVPYAPSKGRYKVYLIDEVHMLSTHSFNALLKTLEEPPAHVIFILATTELDKLPATILSRCLQFHLLHLQPDEITPQLKKVLDDQQISYEDEAIQLIADAAEGSMRDALSLLDQALAFSGSESLSALPLHQLYGTTPYHTIKAIWDAIIEQDFQSIQQQCNALAHTSADYHKLLNQLIQITFDAVVQNPATEQLESLHRIYQYFMEGKEMLSEAPTARIGFEMCLLKAATFHKSGITQTVAQEPTIQPKPETITSAPKIPNSAPTTNQTTAKPSSNPPTQSSPQQTQPQATLILPISNWSDAIAALNLSAATKMLATNCTLHSQSNDKIILAISKKHRALVNHQQIKRIEEALIQATQQKIRLNIECQDDVSNTPQQQQEAAQQNAQDQLTQQFKADPAIQALEQQFGANIQNVQPRDKVKV